MTWNLICVALNTVELTENPAPSLIWCITRSRTCGALLFRLFSTSLDFTQLDFTPLDSGSASVFIAFFLRSPTTLETLISIFSTDTNLFWLRSFLDALLYRISIDTNDTNFTAITIFVRWNILRLNSIIWWISTRDWIVCECVIN